MQPALSGNRSAFSPAVAIDLVDEWFRLLPAACTNAYGRRLVSLVVFGSVARGKPGPTSDFDLLVVADDLPGSRMARNRQFEVVEHTCRDLLAASDRAGWLCDLSPVILSPAECDVGSLLFLDMTIDAKILLDRGGFMRGRLDRLAADLRRLGATRKMHGHETWTWTLKPDWKPGERIEL